MCRSCSNGRGEGLEVSGCEPEQTEAEATADLLRVGGRILLVVAAFFTLCTFGCVSCMAFGPDRPGSPPAPLHAPVR